MSDAGEVEEEDVERLSLSQLKSESVRLDKAAARLEARRSAVRERIGRIVAANRGPPPRLGEKKRRARPPREGRPPQYRPLCAAAGCDNHVQRDGLCIRHGAHLGRRCTHAGCALHAQRGGPWCYRHGAAVKPCAVDGCENRVQRKGVCYKHGARDGVRKCRRPSCRNVVKADGLCRKHLDGTLDRTGAESAACPAAATGERSEEQFDEAHALATVCPVAPGAARTELSTGGDPAERFDEAHAAATVCPVALDAEASEADAATRIDPAEHFDEAHAGAAMGRGDTTMPDAEASDAEASAQNEARAGATARREEEAPGAEAWEREAAEAVDADWGAWRPGGGADATTARGA